MTRSTIAIAIAAFVTGLLLNQVTATPKPPGRLPPPPVHAGPHIQCSNYVLNGDVSIPSDFTPLTAIGDGTNIDVIACKHVP